MAVTAPPLDIAGAALDAQIATVQALVTGNKNPLIETQLIQQLNSLQVNAVIHYMVTGWLNAGSNILVVYSPPSWDVQGQKYLKRITGLTTLYNNAVTAGMPVGNAAGYGGSGWTTIASAFAQQLYAEQTKLVMHLMTLPGGTLAATMLANLTGVQTAPAGITFNYSFSSVGFTDADNEGDG
jgi:hypothetical protein